MSAGDGPDFASLLRRYRRRGGLTQEELAERAGLSPASVSLLERGITLAPQKATVSMLAAALELSAAEAAAFLEHARAPRRTEEAALDSSLPVPLTTLIGREREQAALMDLLGRAATRLLTLTGPAGVGKTRLALELAATLQHKRRQDVVFVGLIPVQEPERVLPAIAQALGVHESASLPLREALVRTLRERAVVLVLDNFEQLLPAARAVLELLIACPRVKALVTSRSALNVRGEQSFPVAPLALPELGLMDSLEQLRQVPSVALFIERASAVWPAFSVTTLQDAQLIAGICARLDGLPLAIELAAARVRHFGLRQLHDHLAVPAFLNVLDAGPQDLADHQRTMRSTVAWSYELLGAAERRLFRWLGVFVGGATFDAVEAVAGSGDQALLASLTALTDASLLQWGEVAGTWRYTQLVTLRAYAEEQLRASGEWGEARRRHAEYFLGLAELIVPQGADQQPGVMVRVEMEYENMRAVLSWAWEMGMTLHGLRMAGALWRFWFTHAHFLEGLDWLERFVARMGTPTGREERGALAQAWTGVAAISYRLDRFERARDAAERALALRLELGDTTQTAFALMNLATAIRPLGELDRALALYNECLALHREAGNRPAMVVPLLNLGGVYLELGQPREALAYYDQSLTLSREVGESELARAFTWHSVGEAYIVLDEPARAIEVITPSHQFFQCERDAFGTATCAFTLGRAEWRVGELERAQAYLDEAERLFRALGSSLVVVHIRYFRASVALERGDSMAARHDLASALDDLSGQPGEREAIWCLVERAGTLACRAGAPELAARLYTAAMSHRDASQRPLEPAERDLRARDLACLRTTLGESAFAGAAAAGEGLTVEDAVAALRQLLRECE